MSHFKSLRVVGSVVMFASQALAAENAASLQASVETGGSVAPAANVSADRPTSGAPKAYDDAALGLEAALGAGFAFSGGEFVGGQSYSKLLEGHVPLRLDLGFRILPRLVVGAYGVYAPALLWGKNRFTCTEKTTPAPDSEQVDCGGTVKRAGLQVTYRFQPHEPVDPWAAVGAGVEGITVREANTDRRLSAMGIEFFNLSAGLDAHVLKNTTVGPLVQVAFGTYTALSYDCGDVATCAPLENQKPQESGIHRWFTAGVRAVQLF